MKSKVVIGAFGPSARQIGDAARLITQSPATEVVVKSKPEDGTLVFGDQPYGGRRRKDYERGLAYLHELSERRQLVNQVFLGGACDPTTWRKDIAIPAMEEAGVAFYNPQVADWSPELLAIEAGAKTTSFVLLFVFDPATRAIATLNEAIEFIADGKQKVVLVMDYVQPGTDIAGQTLNVAEAMDINIARAELMGWAKAKGTPIFTSIHDAVDACIAICHDAAEDKHVIAV